MTKALLVLAVLVSWSSSALAGGNVYWDPTNGTAAGTGAAAPAATWGGNQWGDSAGTAAPAAWNNANGDTMVFAAGTDATGVYTITVPAGTAITLAGIIREEGTPTFSDAAAGATPITFADGANLAIDSGTGTLIVNAFFGTTNGTITKTGTGILSPGTSQNAFKGKWVSNAGSLSFAGDLRIGLTTGAAADAITLNNGAKLRSSTAAVAFDVGRGITLGNSGGGGFDQASTVTLTWNGPITGTSGGPLLQAGAGTTILTNTNNNWDGATIVSAGNLKLGASGVIPDTSVVSTTASGVSFDLNGFDETIKSLTQTAGNILTGAKTLTLANPNGEIQTAGVVNVGSGGTLIKNGSGAITLKSANVNNGEIVLNTGTLGIGGSSALGSSGNTGVVTINGGILSNDGTGGRTIPSSIAANLNVDIVADDSLFNSSAPGQIAFTGPATMNADRTFTINGTANLAFADLRESGGSRNVIKAGSGTLAMTDATAADANAFTGSVTVNAGRLQVSTTSFVGNESNTIILAGGALNSTGNRDVTTAMIKNPITLTADSAITTTSTASTVNLNVNTSTFTLTGGTTLTFRNDGADASTDLFDPRFSGNGFDFTSKINIDNGLGKTRLASFNQGATTQTFSGVISGTGSFRRSSGTATNGGTTIFSNANTFQGGVAVNDGKLQASNGTNGSATGTGQVTVGDGTSGTFFRGYLTGTGTVGNASTGPVVAQEGGTIAPGDFGSSPGTLTTLGDVTMGLNSHLAIELSGSSADKLVVGGNLDLSAAEFLDVTGVGSGTSWLIGTYGGTATGTFDNVTSGYTVTIGSGLITLNAAVAGLPGDFNSDGKVDAGDYATWRKNEVANLPLANDGGAATQADRFTLWRANFGNPPGAGSGGGLGGASVPEPSAIVLLAIGMLAAGFRRRG